MADKTYRVGIIGCGGMGRSHANNWTNTGRAEVVTASDISEASAAKFAEEFSHFRPIIPISVKCARKRI